jgi:hypothetical protein
MKQREAQMECQQQQLRIIARQSSMQYNQDAWEHNQLHSSGAAIASGDNFFNNNSNEEANKIVKPPFLLDGQVYFSNICEAIPTVKNNSSNCAKMARAESNTLWMIQQNIEK